VDTPSPENKASGLQTGRCMFRCAALGSCAPCYLAREQHNHLRCDKHLRHRQQQLRRCVLPPTRSRVQLSFTRTFRLSSLGDFWVKPPLLSDLSSLSTHVHTLNPWRPTRGPTTSPTKHFFGPRGTVSTSCIQQRAWRLPKARDTPQLHTQG